MIRYILGARVITHNLRALINREILKHYKQMIKIDFKVFKKMFRFYNQMSSKYFTILKFLKLLKTQLSVIVKKNVGKLGEQQVCEQIIVISLK